jgi:hypothetical protein
LINLVNTRPRSGIIVYHKNQEMPRLREHWFLSTDHDPWGQSAGRDSSGVTSLNSQFGRLGLISGNIMSVCGGQSGNGANLFRIILFSLQFLFRLMLHTHLLSGAGAVGPLVVGISSEPSLIPSQELNIWFVRFKFFTEVVMKSSVFWDIMQLVR